MDEGAFVAILWYFWGNLGGFLGNFENEIWVLKENYGSNLGDF